MGGVSGTGVEDGRPKIEGLLGAKRSVAHGGVSNLKVRPPLRTSLPNRKSKADANSGPQQPAGPA